MSKRKVFLLQTKLEEDIWDAITDAQWIDNTWQEAKAEETILMTRIREILQKHEVKSEPL